MHVFVASLTMEDCRYPIIDMQSLTLAHVSSLVS